MLNMEIFFLLPTKRERRFTQANNGYGNLRKWSWISFCKEKILWMLGLFRHYKTRSFLFLGVTKCEYPEGLCHGRNPKLEMLRKGKRQPQNCLLLLTSYHKGLFWEPRERQKSRSISNKCKLPQIKVPFLHLIFQRRKKIPSFPRKLEPPGDLLKQRDWYICFK